MVDGSVKTLSPDVTNETIKGLITRNGNELIRPDVFLNPEPEPRSPPLYLELRRNAAPAGCRQVSEAASANTRMRRTFAAGSASLSSANMKSRPIDSETGSIAREKSAQEVSGSDVIPSGGGSSTGGNKDATEVRKPGKMSPASKSSAAK